jgi:vacuolar-type H+-ATPase subunit E/Vma4
MARTLGDITGELTERVISPAKAESERIIKEAHAEAERVLTEARKESIKIQDAAKQEAGQTLKQMEVDLHAASRSFIILLQEKIEAAIVQPTVEGEIREVLKDKEFLKRIIEILLHEFTKLHGTESNIEILLPEKEKAALSAWFVDKFHQKAMSNITVHFTDKVSFGFKLGLEDKGSHFNFGKGLVEVFSGFCSLRFRKYFLPAKED